MRGTDAYRAGHIPGARAVGPADFAGMADSLKQAGGPIVTYCAPAEQTSARAALMLRNLGVPGVRVLKGGWRDWVQAGLPTVKGDRIRHPEAVGQ